MKTMTNGKLQALRACYHLYSFLLVAAMIVLGRCQDNPGTMLGSEEVSNLDEIETQRLEGAEASSAIDDGAHGGLEGFYFLPPMVRNTSTSGTFDAGLSPEIMIAHCATAACEAPNAEFNINTGVGGAHDCRGAPRTTMVSHNGHIGLVVQ